MLTKKGACQPMKGAVTTNLSAVGVAAMAMIVRVCATGQHGR